MTVALQNELFRKTDIRRPLTRDFSYFKNDNVIYPNAFMPAMDVSPLPQDIRKPVKKGIEEVRKEDPVGITEERYHGSLPVQIDHNPPYAGVTEFEKGYDGRPKAKRMGISNKLTEYNAKRIAKHEARHVRSEALLKYADLPQKLVTAIMESYAEFGQIKAAKKAGNHYEADEIITNTPYPHHIKLGIIIDKMYESNYDRKRGYEAFIRDIQKNQSMKLTLQRLGENIKNDLGKYKGLMENVNTYEDLRKAA